MSRLAFRGGFRFAGFGCHTFDHARLEAQATAPSGRAIVGELRLADFTLGGLRRFAKMLVEQMHETPLRQRMGLAGSRI